MGIQEPNLMTVLFMVLASAVALGGITACLGGPRGQRSTYLLCSSLLMFALAYVLFSFIRHPLRNVFFAWAHVAFSGGLSGLLATLLRFQRRPVPVTVLTLIPLATGMAFWILLDTPILRTRVVSMLLLVQPLWMCLLLLRRHPRHLELGEWLFFGGLLCLAGGTLLRLWNPSLTIAIAAADDSVRTLKASFFSVFVALHLLTMGYFLMDRTRRERSMEKAAQEDALTGVATRRRLVQTLQAQVQVCHRRGQPLSVMMLDVDHFKRINDQCGHLGGDQVLGAIGQLLNTQIRDDATVGRYGGEEFLIICPNTNATEVGVQAERLRAAIQSGIRACGNGVELDVTVSIGTYTYHERNPAPPPWEELVLCADKALYQAKRQGRNQVQAHPGMRSTHARDVAWDGLAATANAPVPQLRA